MLVDSNILITAVDESAPAHEKVKSWLESALNDSNPVAIPWDSIGAFLRIITNPRVFVSPLLVAEAWGYVTDWLSAGPSWVPQVNKSTFAHLGQLIDQTSPSGDLIPDAMLAALCLDYDLPIATLDYDFGRFAVRVINPSMPNDD